MDRDQVRGRHPLSGGGSGLGPGGPSSGVSYMAARRSRRCLPGPPPKPRQRLDQPQPCLAALHAGQGGWGRKRAVRPGRTDRSFSGGRGRAGWIPPPPPPAETWNRLALLAAAGIEPARPGLGALGKFPRCRSEARVKRAPCLSRHRLLALLALSRSGRQPPSPPVPASPPFPAGLGQARGGGRGRRRRVGRAEGGRGDRPAGLSDAGRMQQEAAGRLAGRLMTLQGCSRSRRRGAC
ncbi:uncharacterized protein LOC128322298 [Hemicordylus capensis]|uniref:uncharacterized protein LOC128322298 n=1 Tax=Hemicordylus capensis TaxID=884348 RepID=UPI0023041608|nr:uncharacterized protein LOC128322298 [Hemicordylus capensis]